MDHLNPQDEVVATVVAEFPESPVLLQAMAAWARQDPGCMVVARRFGRASLSGRDLREVRTKLLGLSQDEVALMLCVSRNSVSRMENSLQPDGKSRYAYLGLILSHFVLPRLSGERSEP